MARWTSLARGISVGLAVAVGWLAAAAWLHDPSPAPHAGRWDAIVVLGCNVRDDGAPSVALRRRVRHAVELWRRGLAPRVVFTGGVGEGKPVSEARAAARFAASLGLPPDAVLLEEESRSTEENARFAREVLGDGHVLVVSDGYHVARGERVFSRYFEQVSAAGVPGAPLGGALREVVAIAAYALLGRLGDPHAPPAEDRLARLGVPVAEPIKPGRRRAAAARRA